MRLAPALITVMAVVVVAWLTWPRLFVPVSSEREEPHLSVTGTPNLGQWAYDLLYPHELTGAAERDESAILPDDYRMIAQVFLDR